MPCQREDSWYLYGAEQGRPCPRSRAQDASGNQQTCLLGQPLPAAALCVPSWAGCGPFPLPRLSCGLGGRLAAMASRAACHSSRWEGKRVVGDYDSPFLSPNTAFLYPSGPGLKRPCSLSGGGDTAYLSCAGSLYSAPTFADLFSAGP